MTVHKANNYITGITLSYEDKLKILKKSEFRCAHCGKKVGFNNLKTPYSLLPTLINKLNNKGFVALCQDCEPLKSPFFVLYNSDIKEYYKYIKEDCFNDLLSAVKGYDVTKNWFDWNNWLPKESIVIPNLKKFGKRLIWLETGKQPLKLKKAEEADFDRLVEFAKTLKIREFGDDDDLDFIVKIQSLRGSTYYLEDYKGVVVGFISIAFLSQNGIYIPRVRNFFCKPKYASILLNFIVYIANTLIDTFESNFSCVLVSLRKTDKHSNKAIKHMANVDIFKREEVFNTYLLIKSSTKEGDAWIKQGIPSAKLLIFLKEEGMKYKRYIESRSEYVNKENSLLENIVSI